jgi:hypothetical protein
VTTLTLQPAAVDPPGAGMRAIWLATTLAGTLAAAAWIATGEPAGPACLFRQIVHVDCPTCGMTRALTLLTRGEWQASLAVHPGAAALVVQVFAAWLAWTRWLFRGGHSPDRWIPAAILANGVALIALWLVRLGSGMLPR